MDCLKDFKEQEYVAHTKVSDESQILFVLMLQWHYFIIFIFLLNLNYNAQNMNKKHLQCITEAERYSAKGFVAKPERNKGAQKQEIWTECIQELAERPNFDRNTKNVLQRIAGQSNVPRKKPKFINFLKSSMRYSAAHAEQIWTIIEDGLEEFKKKSAPAQLPATKPDTSAAQAEADVVPETSSDSGDAIQFEHVDDKNPKLDTDQINGTSSAVSVVAIIEHALNQSRLDKSTKKILKKLQKSTDIPLNVQSPKKKKFIKFLQEQFATNADVNETVWNSLSQSIKMISSTPNGNSSGIVSKKRKNTDAACNDSGKKSKTEVSMADSTTDANGEPTFDWQKHIVRIFNKNKSNNQVPLAALKSKVIKKFLKSIGDDESKSAQYDKLFKKSLKKVNELTFAGGVVQLKT